jgi:hypothetical protein
MPLFVVSPLLLAFCLAARGLEQARNIAAYLYTLR